MSKKVKLALTFFIGVLFGALGLDLCKTRRKNLYIEQMNISIDKLTSFYHLLLWWVKDYQNGHTVSENIMNLGYKKVAIYGIKELGERFYYECQSSGVDVLCFIDKCRKNEVFLDKSIPIINPVIGLNGLDKVDVIVVTAITYFDEIKTELESKVKCPIISLEELVYRS